MPIHDRWGRAVAHADLGYARWKVALEYEGRQHAEPDQFGRDIDRYSLLAADGWLTLRFADRHVNGPARARPHSAGSDQPRLAARRVIIDWRGRADAPRGGTSR